MSERLRDSTTLRPERPLAAEDEHSRGEYEEMLLAHALQALARDPSFYDRQLVVS